MFIRNDSSFQACSIVKIVDDLVEVSRPVDDGEEDVHGGLVGNDVNLIDKKSHLEHKSRKDIIISYHNKSWVYRKREK